MERKLGKKYSVLRYEWDNVRTNPEVNNIAVFSKGTLYGFIKTPGE